MCVVCFCWLSQHFFGEEGNSERKGSMLGSPVALYPELGFPGKEAVESHCYSGGPLIFSGFCFFAVVLILFLNISIFPLSTSFIYCFSVWSCFVSGLLLCPVHILTCQNFIFAPSPFLLLLHFLPQ